MSFTLEIDGSTVNCEVDLPIFWYEAHAQRSCEAYTVEELEKLELHRANINRFTVLTTIDGEVQTDVEPERNVDMEMTTAHDYATLPTFQYDEQPLRAADGAVTLPQSATESASASSTNNSSWSCNRGFHMDFASVAAEACEGLFFEDFERELDLDLTEYRDDGYDGGGCNDDATGCSFDGGGFVADGDSNGVGDVDVDVGDANGDVGEGDVADVDDDCDDDHGGDNDHNENDDACGTTSSDLLKELTNMDGTDAGFPFGYDRVRVGVIGRHRKDSEALRRAIAAVLDEGLSLGHAAKKYNVVKSTLWSRVSKHPKHQQRKTNETLSALIHNKLMAGVSLSQISRSLQVAKSTVHQHKLRLTKQGRLQPVDATACGDGKGLQSRLVQAYRGCRVNGMSVRFAAEFYSLPLTTLWRFIKRSKQAAASAASQTPATCKSEADEEEADEEGEEMADEEGDEDEEAAEIDDNTENIMPMETIKDEINVDDKNSQS